MTKIRRLLLLCAAFAALWFFHNVSIAKAETCHWRGQAGASALMSDLSNWYSYDAGGCRLDMGSALVFGAIAIPPMPTYYNRNATWDNALPRVGSIEMKNLYTGLITVAASNATIYGDFKQYNGIINFGDVSLRVTGDFIKNGGTIYPSNSTVRLGCVPTTGPGGLPIPCIVIPGTSFTDSVGGSSNPVFHNLAIDAGNYIFDRNVTINNQLTISSGSSANAGTSTITFTGSSSTPFIKNGSFNSGSSTIVYTGTGSVNITPATYYNLHLTGGGNYTLAGPTGVTNGFSLRSFSRPTSGTLSLNNNILTITGPSFSNFGIINESSAGYIRRRASSIKLTDSFGTEETTYNTATNSVYVTVRDDDANLNGTAVNTITSGVSVRASTYNDTENITLTETGPNTGIFKSGPIAFSVAANAINGNGRFEVSGNGTLFLNYTDSLDGFDTDSDQAGYTGTSFSGTAPPPPPAPSPPAPSPPTPPSSTPPTTPIPSTTPPGTVIFLNPTSGITINNIVTTYQNTSALTRFNYQFRNNSGVRQRYKIITEALNDPSGTTAQRRTIRRAMRPNVTINRKTILRVPSGNTYIFKVRVLDARTRNLIDWNGFRLSL